IESGVFAGQIETSAPVDQLRTVAAWSARGQLTAKGVEVSGLSDLAGSVDFEFRENALRIDRARLQSNFGELTVTAQLGAASPYGLTARLTATVANLVSAREALRLDQSVALSGSGTASASVHGTLADKKLAGSSVVELADVLVAGVSIPRLHLRADSDGHTLTVTGGSASIADGRLRFAASAPLLPAGLARGTVSWQGVSLAPLAQLAKAPLAVAGTTDGTANVAVAMVRGTELTAWQAEGRIGLTNLNVATVTSRRAAAAVRLAAGIASIANLDADLNGGNLRASAQVSLLGDERASISGQWQGIDIARSIPAYITLPAGLSLVTAGSLEAEGTRFSLEPAAWAGRVNAQATAAMRGRMLAAADAALRLAESMVHLDRLSARLPAGNVTAQGNFSLRSPYSVEAVADLPQFDLSALGSLIPSGALLGSLSGQLSAHANVRGDLAPTALRGTATASGAALSIANVTIDRGQAELAFDGDHLSLDRAELSLCGGTATATASVPLALDQHATSAAIHWQEIDLARLPFVPRRYAQGLSATSDGKATLDIGAGKVEQIDTWTADVNFRLPKLVRGDLPLGSLESKLHLESGKLTLVARASALAGRAEIDATLGWRQASHQFALDDARAEISDMQLADLAPLLRNPQLARLQGTLAARLDYRPQPAVPNAPTQPLGSGAIVLSGLRWADELLSNRLEGNVRIAADAVELTNLAGDLAGGTVTILGREQIGGRPHGFTAVELRNLDLRRLLAAKPSLASQASGRLDLQLRARLGVPCRFEAVAALNDAKLAALHLGGVRIPLEGTWNPRDLRTHVVVRDLHAQLAQGRIAGRAEIDLGTSTRVEGNLTATNVDLRSLGSSFGSTGRLGTGRLTGEVRFAGNDVRSLDDLTATMRAKLRNTQAMTIPVLDQLQPLLSAGLSTSTQFDQGDLQATLAGGVMRIRRFALAGRSARIFASGNVSLAGRLDLELTAQTGQQGAGGPLATFALNRLPLAATTPAGWIIEANELLSNRVLNLHVGGTVRSPTVQVRPVALLEQEALRFFLGRAVNGASAVPY
ncbi:MAG TPA: AsmA-like C-terminal region-containing protein, partial [Pirellulales bacterium]|nr:AsmA-like C-terminal region-containing protein [Pirellulales bacterium]